MGTQPTISWVKICVAHVAPHWRQIYFAHALECDTPILEALWCAVEPRPLQAIWQELAEKDTGLFDEPSCDVDALFARLECDGWRWTKELDTDSGKWSARRGTERLLQICLTWQRWTYHDLGWLYDIQWQEPGQPKQDTNFLVGCNSHQPRRNLWHHLTSKKGALVGDQAINS